MYVDHTFHGKRIGTALLTEGLKQLEDAQKVIVHVERDNEIGQRFYKAKGFTFVKEFEENFVEFKLKTVEMELRRIK